MLIIDLYHKLTKIDIICSIIGLITGLIGSYYIVDTNQNLSNIITYNGYNNYDLILMYIRSAYIIFVVVAIREGCFTYIEKRINEILTCIVYTKLFYKEHEFYEITSVSSLIDICKIDIKNVADIFSLYLNIYSRSISNIIITIFILSRISIKLTTVMIIILLFFTFISNISNNSYKYYQNKRYIIIQLINTHIYETISNISVIKIYANEIKIFAKLKTYYDEILFYNYIDSIYNALNTLYSNNINIITNIILLLLSYYNNINCIAFLIHKKNLFDSVKKLADIRFEYIKCTKSLTNINNIINNNNFQNKGNYIPITENIYNICFHNIYFKYQKSNDYILYGFNLILKKGDKIGIIGPSGCGKSTFIKLLMNILQQQQGTIYINNLNMMIYDNQWLKQQFGYVSQDIILFSDSILNNITYGLTTYDINDVFKIAKLTNIHEFILKLPNGYNTMYNSTEMSSLSGGQKQRIAITRALIRKPKILLLDEATSALDSYNEEMVQQTINNCCIITNTILIVIAHKKTALNIVDTIYKLTPDKLERMS